jgi:regulator of sigma E protease
VPNSAAANAGLQEGDQIVQIGDTANPNWEDIGMKEAASAGHALSVWYVRNGDRRLVTITPTLNPKTGTGYVGLGGQTDIEIAGYSVPNSPAAKAGLQPGDVIVSVNGQAIHANKVHDIIIRSEGKPVEMTYSRNGKLAATRVIPEWSDNNGTKEWMIGVKLQPKVVWVSLPFPEALSESVKTNAKSATFIYSFLRGIAERRMSPKSMEGPIGIVQISGEEARQGPMAYFGLMAALSLNLAIVNLLPIPILDGATIFMLILEMFMRRDLSLRVKEAAFRLGFVFLMAVVAFVLYNDISKLAG